MGYAHIENLYRPDAQQVLLFKECYALEKIHGTSAHISWDEGALRFFSGGESYECFCALFNTEELKAAFQKLEHPKVTVYGEAYGGKQQGMRLVYGPTLRFVAFDVLVGDAWLEVPKAAAVADSLGLSFVPYSKVSTELVELDAERDKPSEQSVRNGLLDGATYNSSKREGVVLRPLIEVRTKSGSRICAKHKRADFIERKTNPRVVDPSRLEVLTEANAIADEWVTEMRLAHVLDKLGNPTSLETVPAVIAAMLEDVTREASGEIKDSKEARKAIGARTVKLYKALVTAFPKKE